MAVTPSGKGRGNGKKHLLGGKECGKWRKEEGWDIISIVSSGSGSGFLTSYGSGSACQKVTVPMVVPVPVRQHLFYLRLLPVFLPAAFGLRLVQ